MNRTASKPNSSKGNAMKMLPLVLVLLALAGCTPQKPAATKPDPIKALETRIEIQQQQIFKLQNKQSNTVEVMASMNETMRQVNDTLILNLQNSEAGWKLLKSHMEDTNAHPPTRIRYVAAPYQAPATVSKPPALTRGVPTAVFDQIKARAIGRYPTDYDMQDFIIREQIEA